MKSNRLTPLPYPLPAGVDLRWIWHYSNLVALRDRLRSGLAQRAVEAAEPWDGGGADPSDGAGAELDHDAALAQLGSEEDALMEIEAAIERLNRGTYGYCEATGRRIPAARLHALPWCRFSVEAQSARESRSRTAHSDR